MTGDASIEELLDPAPARALAALLDLDGVPAGPLPPLWHWVYLLDRPRQDQLGPDGHVRPADADRDRPPRRMFAGGRLTTHAPLELGRPATRTVRVAGVRHTVGRTGPLTFVTVRHDVAQDGRPALTDEQDLVYREATAVTAITEATGTVGSATPVEPARSVAAAGGPRLQLDVDPIALFRFSALTYNAHRIHYDLPFARAEGYPDLVVHGPLQVLLMSELLRRAHRPFTGRTFEYRLVAPVFGAQRLVVGHDESGAVDSAVVRVPGGVTARGRLGAQA